MTIRAKFNCNGVKKFKAYNGVFQYEAEFFAVGNSDPGEENASFFAATPNGNIKLSTIKDDLFEPGKQYYIDFIEA